MAKNLLIVESPAKAKTISKILGKDYQVKASSGHIRDLPKKKLGGVHLSAKNVKIKVATRTINKNIIRIWRIK